MNTSKLELCRWHPVSDVPALQQKACETILKCSEQAIRDRGQFHFVFAGGNTPKEVYRRLSAAQVDWASWHIYFGDERCLPPDDPDRNSRMALDVWLGQVPIPTEHIHIIPTELGALPSAKTYAGMLKAVREFDLVLLGLGEDGHTASLFPHQDWGTVESAPDTLAVSNAPKPPPERVSLSAARLSRTRNALFLVNGQSKQEAVTAWREGKNIPARAIRPPGGVDVLVEAALLAP